MQSVSIRLCHTLGVLGQQGWREYCTVLHCVTLEVNKGHKHSAVISYDWVAPSNLLDFQDLQGSHASNSHQCAFNTKWLKMHFKS